MQSFRRQSREALTKSGAANLMAMFNAKGRLVKGEIEKVDISCMQRGGTLNHPDVKGDNKKKVLSSGKQYAEGGLVLILSE